MVSTTAVTNLIARGLTLCQHYSQPRERSGYRSPKQSSDSSQIRLSIGAWTLEQAKSMEWLTTASDRDLRGALVPLPPISSATLS